MGYVIETRGTLGDKFVKGLAAAVYDVRNQADMAYSLSIDAALGVENNQYTRLFKQWKSTQARETIASKTGVGYAEVTPEGSNYKSDSRIASYETQFNFVKPTNSVTITEEDVEDRLVSAKLDEARDLMIGMKMTMDRDAFSIFNYGFSAQTALPKTLTYYGDGKPLFSTLHPVKGVAGTTQSNASSTSIPLTEINFETARTAIRRQTDDRGLPMNIGSGRLILLVPDSLEKQAVIIAKSKLRSNTLNNDLNIYDGIVTVISSKWINAQNGGSDTAWYVIDSLKSPFIFFLRKGITTDTYKVPENKNVVTDISARYQIGNIDFRGAWGSKGDGSAYSS